MGRLEKMPETDIFKCDGLGIPHEVRLQALIDIQFHYPEIIQKIIEELRAKGLRDLASLDKLAIRQIQNTIYEERVKKNPPPLLVDSRKPHGLSGRK